MMSQVEPCHATKSTHSFNHMSNWAHTFWFWLLVENIYSILKNSVVNIIPGSRSSLIQLLPLPVKKVPSQRFCLCCCITESLSLLKFLSQSSWLVSMGRKELLGQMKKIKGSAPNLDWYFGNSMMPDLLCKILMEVSSNGFAFFIRWGYFQEYYFLFCMYFFAHSWWVASNR